MNCLLSWSTLSSLQIRAVRALGAKARRASDFSWTEKHFSETPTKKSPISQRGTPEPKKEIFQGDNAKKFGQGAEKDRQKKGKIQQPSRK